MKLFKITIVGGLIAGMVAFSTAPAFALDCFLTHASPNSHQGSASTWMKFDLADVLAAPVDEEGFGLECQEQVDAALADVHDAGLPTVFFSRSDTVLPDAGGPGKGGIDHFDDSPIIGQIAAIAADVQANVECP